MIRKAKRKKCIVEWCDEERLNKINKFCQRHDKQMRYKGCIYKTYYDINNCEKKCTIMWCNNKIVHKTGKYCNKHYVQVQRYGGVFKRTIYDENEIINRGKYSLMILYNKMLKPIAKAIIDTNLVSKIKKHKWSFTTRGYVSNGKVGYLHHYILNFKYNKNIDKETDHINGNSLDNRKCNLRICSQRENMLNVKRKYADFLYEV